MSLRSATLASARPRVVRVPPTWSSPPCRAPTQPSGRRHAARPSEKRAGCHKPTTGDHESQSRVRPLVRGPARDRKVGPRPSARGMKGGSQLPPWVTPTRGEGQVVATGVG